MDLSKMQDMLSQATAMREQMEQRLAATIVEADSGGGAGIQADLKTMSALGVFGMTAITAVTAQNTTGVYGIAEMDLEFVALQIEVCVADLGCDAVKTGMLSNAAIIEVVAAKIGEHRLRPLVVDPVMVSKSGAPLLKPDAIETLKRRLLPLATVTTPNLHEAGALLGREIKTVEQMKEAARAIRDLGPENVVVKGGHLEGVAADVLFDGHDFTEYSAERIDTKNNHGTGCVFASAIAASTVWARFCAPSGLRFGARRDGDLTTPASIAASASEMLRADLPK